jgi:hypothetical protein
MSAQPIRSLLAVGVVGLLLGGCAKTPDWVPFASWFNAEDEAPVATAPPTAAADYDPEQEVASGAFIGQNGHISRGRVRIIAQDGQMQLRFLNDFILDDACEGAVTFGKDGIRPEAQIAQLQADAGPQRYTIPGGLAPQSYHQVWIICGEVPRAKAELIFL